MKKVFAFVMFMGVLALAACGGGTGMDGGDGDGGDGCGGCGGGGTDMTETMMQSYIDGTAKASYWIQVHADPAAGQYWETSYTMAGVGTTTTRWQIAKTDGDLAFVESQTNMEGEYSSYNYVIAYQVNTAAGEGEPNVEAAWIGEPGGKPTEIQVMEVPEATCGGCGTMDYEMTEEQFADVELAGAKWSGTLTTIKGDGWESKTWVATDGWFGGVIKTDNGSFVTELVAFGDDAEPLLDWS